MQEEKKFNIRTIIAICLACLLLLGTADLVFSARAAETEEPSGGVYQALLQIKAVYPDQYFYFTQSGNACYYNSGSDCLLTNIPSRGGLPSGAEVGYRAWSCVSFAHYVFYCVFGTTFSAGTKVSSPSVGDVIHTTGPGSDHHSVYLGEDASYWYVFDGNWGNGCGVRWYGKISKSTCTLHEIYHAKNYDAVNGSDVTLGLRSAVTEKTETADAEETTVLSRIENTQESVLRISGSAAEESERPTFTAAELEETTSEEDTASVRRSDRTPPEKPERRAFRNSPAQDIFAEETTVPDADVTLPVYGTVKTGSAQTEPENAEAYLPGDVNLDGAVTAADARLALRAAVAMGDEIEGVMFNNCDIDGNDAITAYDARMILRAAVGLE